MNTIAVATDFSAAADNAMMYAAQLAKKLSADLLLIHAYQMPVSMNEVPVMMIPVEEIKNSAEAGLERVKQSVQKNYPNVAVDTETRLGDAATEIPECCEQVKPILLVAGKQGAGGVERFLFGNTALSIIRHSKMPVIVVPQTTATFSLTNIALAVDDSNVHMHQPAIQKLCAATSASLHIVHVKQYHENRLHTQDIFKELKPQLHTITNESFVSGIKQFLHNHAIDMLIIIPHQHSWMERIFFKTHTADLLEKVSIPIMCLPERNEESGQ